MSDKRKSGQVPGSRTPPPGRESLRSEPRPDLRRDLAWRGKGDIPKNPTPPGPETNDSPRPGDKGRGRHAIIFLVLFFGMVAIAASFVPYSIFDRPMLLGSILVGATLGFLYTRGLRMSGGVFMRNLAIWGVLTFALGGVYYIAGEPNLGHGRSLHPKPGKIMVSDSGDLVVARAADGHYWLDVAINGTTIPMMVDTGASDMVLARRDAEMAGVDTDRIDYLGTSNTANGAARFGVAQLGTLEVGPVSVRGVRVSVMEDPDGLVTSLFGMRALEMFSSFEFRGGKLILRP